MKNGKIQAEGKHDELMKKSEMYANLWNLSEGAKEWSAAGKDSKVTMKEAFV